MAAKPWRVAKSLDVLLKQVNDRWPDRSKASDGAKGDDKHAARPSDHNPNKAGVVTARDITHDPKHGLDARALAEALVASKDKRIKYIISNGQICSGLGANHPAWKWRTYTGVNAHKRHVHISVRGDKSLYDNTDPWRIEGKKPDLKVVPAPSPIVEPAAVAVPEVVAAPVIDKAAISAAQKRLAELGYNPGGADGLMGPLTKGSVLAFRNDNGLIVKDEIDQDFLTALMVAKPRAMVPARANATPAHIAKVVPEAKSHLRNKITAVGSAAAAGVWGAVNQLAPATGYLQPVKDFVGEIPTWTWVVAIVGVAGFIAWNARKGQKAADEAYRSGDRR